mgnify:CR=1 FL=1
MCLAKYIKDKNDLALFILRLSIGVIFLAHGYQKLFIMKPVAVAGFLKNLGFPFSDLFGWILSLTEFIGGLALIVGIAVRGFAILLSIVMVLAILLVKTKIGLIGQGSVGAELDLALLSSLIVLILKGGGIYSLEQKIFKKELC